KLHLTIPAVDSGTHSQRVDCRQNASQWNHDRDERNKCDEQPVNKNGQPERQIALQKWRTGFIQSLGDIAGRQVTSCELGVLPSTLEQSRRCVNFACTLEQQTD